VFTALEMDGLASDTAIADVAPIVGYRVQIAVGDSRHQCCDPAAVALVAIAPTDPSLPGAARSALRELAPGTAITAAALSELVGGWVAMPGLNLRVTASADLGDDGVVVIGLPDAAAFLQADNGDRLLVRTTAVLARPPDVGEGHRGDLSAIPPEWQVVADGVPSIPLRPTVIHDHEMGGAVS
jgi:hypothetical protein